MYVQDTKGELQGDPFLLPLCVCASFSWNGGVSTELGVGVGRELLYKKTGQL